MIGTTDREDAQATAAVGEALRRIAQFADLGPDWDSYGAAPSSPVARAAAGRWVETVARTFGSVAGERVRPYSVAPLADGGVQLEWRGPGGAIEVDVDPSGDVGYLLQIGEGTAARYEEVETAAEATVLRLLARVLVP